MVEPGTVLGDLAGTLAHGARSPWTPEEARARESRRLAGKGYQGDPHDKGCPRSPAGAPGYPRNQNATLAQIWEGVSATPFPFRPPHRSALARQAP
jgi:hypothetical protein